MALLPAIARRWVRPIMQQSNQRYLSSTTTPATGDTSSSTNQSMDDINQMFGEARLCLQDATESKGTVYFEDDFNDAKQATLDTIRAFDDLCASVSSQKRQSLLEANAPKMAQLKQEFKMLEDELIHDDSEEDHTPSPAATRESQAKSLKSERARIELPPPPDDLVRDEHGASRKRRRPEKPTLPAVLPVGPREDRFLVHVFFPISHSHLQSFVKILMGQARLRMVGSPLKASLNSLEHFHVSLSRPATIRSNMIHDLVCDLRKAVSQCDAGSFDLEQDVIALQNKNKHRLFLASPLSNAAASSLPIQLINKISEVFVKHGLPRFFEDPRPHMSFAWTETIEVQPLFKEPRRESQTGLQVDVKEVSCTIGKSRFNFALRIDQ